MEGKYWLLENDFDIAEAYAYNMSPSARRQVRKLIFEHFEYLIREYKKAHGA